MPSPYIYFQALYAFQGDANAHQLTLEQGTLIRVDALHAQARSSQDGWTWGSIHGYGQPSGWFPTGYVVLTSPPKTSKPTLPWIKDNAEQHARDDTNANTGFEGSVLGGVSPALDYSRSTTKVLDNYDSSNPFTAVQDSGTGLRGDDQITIVDKPTSQNLSHKFQKGWQNVGKASVKLLNRRRRVAAVDSSYKPAVYITPASSASNSSAAR